MYLFFFFFKQKTAYEMRISDWSSDVCSSDLMAKVVCVLYDDPINGYPTSYARDGLPEIHTYLDGQTLPTPKAIDFTPGHLLGSVSGELGLRQRSEERRVGKEGVSKFRFRWSPFHLDKNKVKKNNIPKQ